MKFINPITSADKYVYHYTKIETAINYILKSGTLRLNSFTAMNDPRESKIWNIATFLRPPVNLHPKDWNALSEKVSNTLKQDVKMVCFSRDRKIAVNKWQPEALLDRGFARPSMWHHYADSHNGVCLMFDAEKLNTAFSKQVNQSNLFSAPVTYSDDGIVPQLSNAPFFIDLTSVYSEQQLMSEVRSHLTQWMPDLFFRKLKDWENEEEFRWIYFDDNSASRLLTFDDALEGIVVGERVSKELDEAILRYCALYKADITDLEWCNGYPKIAHAGQPYITHKYLLI